MATAMDFGSIVNAEKGFKVKITALAFLQKNKRNILTELQRLSDLLLEKGIVSLCFDVSLFCMQK